MCFLILICKQAAFFLIVFFINSEVTFEHCSSDVDNSRNNSENG